MKAIWKYPFDFIVDFPFHVLLPVEAKICHVAMQGSWPTFWAIVDTDAPKKNRCFRIFGTGRELMDFDIFTYIASFQESIYVWHLFELMET